MQGLFPCFACKDNALLNKNEEMKDFFFEKKEKCLLSVGKNRFCFVIRLKFRLFVKVCIFATPIYL